MIKESSIDIKKWKDIEKAKAAQLSVNSLQMMQNQFALNDEFDPTYATFDQRPDGTASESIM
jgi:hypothetical protein